MSAGIDAPIGAVLDSGAVGLRYFAEFLPRAEQVRPLGVTLAELRARYDEQRGLDTATLHGDVDVLGRTLTVLDEQLQDQTARAHALDAAWSGSAADTARIFLDRHLQRAQQDRDAIAAAHDAVAEAARALRVVVTDKAETVAAFPDRIDGKGPVEIDAILRGATSVGPNAEHCTQWLTDVFVPHVDQYLRNFDELCTVTDSAVRDIYGRVASAFDAIDDSPYPVPGEANSTGATTTVTPAAPGPHASGVEGRSRFESAPQHPGNAPTSAVLGVPQQAPQLLPQPRGGPPIENLGGLLGGLVGGAMSVVGDVVSGVVDQLHRDPADLGDDPLDENADAATPSEDSASTHADFDVHGSHLHMEKQPDGDLGVRSDSGKTYELSVDEHGDPVLTDPDAPVEQPAPQQHSDDDPRPTAPSEPQPASEPAAPEQPQPEPQSESHSDQESHGAEPAMQMQQPAPKRDSAPAQESGPGDPQLASTLSEDPDEPPDDTGAILAEAGPL